jgi:hypothetical protein
MLTLSQPPASVATATGASAHEALIQSLDAVEAQLGELGQALQRRDALGIEKHAATLHAALAKAVDCFSRAAKQGPLPAPLRRRLVSASGQVAAQRESLARATAALDRAIDVLIPHEAPRGYGANGKALRR